jgi:hypothetical protein
MHVQLAPRVLRAALLAALTGVSLVAGGLLQAGTARADFSWCWDDPVVSIGGITLSTTIGVQADPSQLNNGSSAWIVYAVPAGVSTALVSDTTTYFKEHVSFTTSTVPWTPGQPIPVTVTLSFNQNNTFPAQMRTTEGSSTLSTVSGAANGVLTASFTVQ